MRSHDSTAPLKGYVKNGRLVMAAADAGRAGDRGAKIAPLSGADGRLSGAAPKRVAIGAEQPKRAPAVDFELLAIKTATLIGRPLQRLDVLDRFCRVWLVDFVPHQGYDPIMPITLLSLGEQHDRAWRRLAELLMSWDVHHGGLGSWFAECRQLAAVCTEAAVLRLGQGEAAFFGKKLMYSIANPDNRKLFR